MHKSKRICWSSAVVAYLVFASACAGERTNTDTPAVRQLHAWLSTFNSGDQSQWQKFIAERYPTKPPQTIGADLAFRKETGGFDLVKIEHTSATRAVALAGLRDGEGLGVRLTVEVENGEPYRIVSVGVQPGPGVPVSVPRMTDSRLASALKSELQKRTSADGFSGAVLITRNGRTVFEGAYGMANRSTGLANSLETRFRIGSMNKMFTAVSILQLAQQGKVKLNESLQTYLPDYPNKTVASKVTLHHLLTHTGGTGEAFGPEFDARRLELRTHGDYVGLYGSRDLLFEPGSQWMYSNYGFILLGAVIEKVSGQNYYDYVRDHVYGLADMKATASDPEDRASSGIAVGYMRAPGSDAWEPNTATLPYRGTAAGGGYSTVSDLTRFARALMSHKLLNAEYTKLMTTGKVDAPMGRYAYGFIEHVDEPVHSMGHGGNAPGMDADLRIFPESGHVTVVLANMSPPAAQRISTFIANRATR